MIMQSMASKKAVNAAASRKKYFLLHYTAGLNKTRGVIELAGFFLQSRYPNMAGIALTLITVV